MAIVGARAASGRAVALAHELGSELAARGIEIVSGGAIGVDAAAHRGALDGGGRTIAVLASGLGAPYPARNLPLFDDIVALGGAVVTPYCDDVPPRRFHFVRRNRLIAALADAVVIVDASLSSGSLYTARAAVDLDRVLAAVPGAPGCDALIAQGAAVVESAADVEAALAGRPRRPLAEIPGPDTDAYKVLAKLGVDPIDTDQLSTATGLLPRAVTRALLGLELEGLAVALGGHTYIRSTLAQEALGG